MTDLDVPRLYRVYADTGNQPVKGSAGVHVAFTEVFATFPDLRFNIERTLFGADFWVLDWTLVAHAGATRVDCLDVVTVDESGLVARKDTYVGLAHPTTR